MRRRLRHDSSLECGPERAVAGWLDLSSVRTRGVFEVRTGRVRLMRFGADGRETALFTAGPTERFAEASLFAARYHCDAIALNDAAVACFPKVACLPPTERRCAGAVRPDCGSRPAGDDAALAVDAARHPLGAGAGARLTCRGNRRRRAALLPRMSAEKPVSLVRIQPHCDQLDGRMRHRRWRR